MEAALTEVIGSNLICFPRIDRDGSYRTEWFSDGQAVLYQYETASSASSNRYAKPLEKRATGVNLEFGGNSGGGYGGEMCVVK